jgi:hypothetical protein
VLEVGGMKFALHGLAICDGLLIASELSQGVTKAKNHLVIHNFQELAQTASELQILLECATFT